MPPRLTIAELLKKHAPPGQPKYAFMKTHAAEFGVGAKQFGQWYRGERYPDSDTTLMLVNKMGMLKMPKV